MNRNDSFEAKAICGTELRNVENLIRETLRTYMGSILERQRVLDLQISFSFAVMTPPPTFSNSEVKI